MGNPKTRDIRDHYRQQAAKLEERLKKLRRIVEDLDDLMQDEQSLQPNPRPDGGVSSLSARSRSSPPGVPAAQSVKQRSGASRG